MNTRITNYDDSNLIWFDFNEIDEESLNTSGISNFDITNMPIAYDGVNIIGLPKVYPMAFELSNYFVTFFSDPKSDTGYSCMCVNKNKSIYKSRAGYVNGKPSQITY